MLDFIGFLFFFFAGLGLWYWGEIKQDYVPHVVGMILLFILGLLVYGGGFEYDCGETTAELQDMTCTQSEQPPGLGYCAHWDNNFMVDTNTTYCVNLPYPLPIDPRSNNAEAWDSTNERWIYAQLGDNRERMTTPRYEITLLGVALIVFSIIGMIRPMVKPFLGVVR